VDTRVFCLQGDWVEKYLSNTPNQEFRWKNVHLIGSYAAVRWDVRWLGHRAKSKKGECV